MSIHGIHVVISESTARRCWKPHGTKRLASSLSLKERFPLFFPDYLGELVQQEIELISIHNGLVRGVAHLHLGDSFRRSFLVLPNIVDAGSGAWRRIDDGPVAEVLFEASYGGC